MNEKNFLVPIISQSKPQSRDCKQKENETMNATGKSPTISVVIPTYNYAKLLPRAVASVYPQLAGRHELIVIDDGSTDNTPEVVAELSQSYPEGTRFIRKPNGGPSSVRNMGIKESRGLFLVFLDADDELTPFALKKLEDHMQEHPESRFIIGGHISISDDGKQREHLPQPLPDSPHARLRSYLIDKSIALSNGACAMHRDVFLRGGYPENFRNTEDIPVFAQVLANESCTVIREPLALIHRHDESLRHQIKHAKTIGLSIVDEVFRSERLGAEYQGLRPEFELQRCLSLFRTAYIAKEREMAKDYFLQALRRDWRVLFRLSYSRKAFRLWLS